MAPGPLGRAAAWRAPSTGRVCTAPPLPCLCFPVVGAGGWAGCCGHDVLPLSVDGPGGGESRPRQPGEGMR